MDGGWGAFAHVDGTRRAPAVSTDARASRWWFRRRVEVAPRGARPSGRACHDPSHSAAGATVASITQEERLPAEDRRAGALPRQAPGRRAVARAGPGAPSARRVPAPRPTGPSAFHTSIAAATSASAAAGSAGALTHHASGTSVDRTRAAASPRSASRTRKSTRSVKPRSRGSASGTASSLLQLERATRSDRTPRRAPAPTRRSAPGRPRRARRRTARIRSVMAALLPRAPTPRAAPRARGRDASSRCSPACRARRPRPRPTGRASRRAPRPPVEQRLSSSRSRSSRAASSGCAPRGAPATSARLPRRPARSRGRGACASVSARSSARRATMRCSQVPNAASPRKRGSAEPRAHEGLLRDVLGVGARARDAQRQPDGPVAVQVHEHPEGLLVAVARTRDQFPLVHRGHGRRRGGPPGPSRRRRRGHDRPPGQRPRGLITGLDRPRGGSGFSRGLRAS